MYFHNNVFLPCACSLHIHPEENRKKLNQKDEYLKHKTLNPKVTDDRFNLRINLLFWDRCSVCAKTVGVICFSHEQAQ